MQNQLVMKNLISVSLLLISSVVVTAQVFEHYEDRSYRNKYSDVVNVGDSMWVVSASYNMMNSFFSSAYLKSFDLEGNELWSYDAPLNTEVRTFNHLELLSDGKIVAFGTDQFCCDCTSPQLQLSWFSAQGALLNQITFESIPYWNQKIIAGRSGDLLGVVFQEGWPANHYLMVTDLLGDSLWTTGLGETSINFLISGHDNFWAIGDNTLLGVNENGEIVTSTDYALPPVAACTAFDQRPFILWNDGVYEVNEDGSLQLVIPIPLDSAAIEIFSNQNQLYVRYDDAILHYDEELEMTMLTPYSQLPNWEDGSFSSNNETFARVGARKADPFNMSVYRGGAIQAVAHNGEEMEHYPDLAITSLSIESMNSELLLPDDYEYLYEVTAAVSGYFRNDGDVHINSAFLNYYVMDWICNPGGYRQQYTGLNLAPGDSVSFYFNEVYNIFSLSGDSGQVEFCLMLSDPSNLYDRVPENDKACVSQFVYVGVPEIENEVITAYPNPTSDRIRFDFSLNSHSGELLIFDGRGKVIIRRGFNGLDGLDVDVSNLPAGIYIARVVTAESYSEPVKFSVVH